MSDNYQLVAIDLDGTLLNSNHVVSLGNATQVRRVSAAGNNVVLASGRAYSTIIEFARQLDLPEAMPVIAYNGALVRTVGGETLQHQPLPAEAAQTIVHYCAAHGYHLNYYLNDKLYICEEDAQSRVYEQRTGSVAVVTHDLTCFDGECPTKLLLIDTPEVTDRLCGQFQSEFGDTLYITKTEGEYLEFMHPGISKATALAYAAARLGVLQEHCIAFGDSFNDISMVEWAGLGVAMASGRPELQAVADRIAPPADDDGVGIMLSQIFPAE